jgi:hypothetical protein
LAIRRTFLEAHRFIKRDFTAQSLYLVNATATQPRKHFRLNFVRCRGNVQHHDHLDRQLKKQRTNAVLLHVQ